SRGYKVRCSAAVAALLTLPLTHAGCDPGGSHTPAVSATAGGGAGSFAGGTATSSSGGGGAAGSTSGGGTSSGGASGAGASGGGSSSGGTGNDAGRAGMVGVAGGAWMLPSFDPAELPTRVDTVEILLTEDARAALEAAPFYGEDVLGSFVDGSGRRYDE